MRLRPSGNWVIASGRLVPLGSFFSVNGLPIPRSAHQATLAVQDWGERQQAVYFRRKSRVGDALESQRFPAEMAARFAHRASTMSFSSRSTLGSSFARVKEPILLLQSVHAEQRRKLGMRLDANQLAGQGPLGHRLPVNLPILEGADLYREFPQDAEGPSSGCDAEQPFVACGRSCRPSKTQRRTVHTCEPQTLCLIAHLRVWGADNPEQDRLRIWSGVRVIHPLTIRSHGSSRGRSAFAASL